MAMEGPQKLAFTIPLMEPLPPQYYVRLVSDNWLQVGGGEAAQPSRRQLAGGAENPRKRRQQWAVLCGWLLCIISRPQLVFSGRDPLLPCLVSYV